MLQKHLVRGIEGLFEFGAEGDKADVLFVEVICGDDVLGLQTNVVVEEVVVRFLLGD